MGEDRTEGNGLPGAFSERGSMTRSMSARTRGSGFHHTDLTLQLAAGRRPALLPLLCSHPLLITPFVGGLKENDLFATHRLVRIASR